MATNVREYNFIVGPETSTLPDPGTPSASTDTITKGYADDHYVQGGAPVADLTALKAIGASDRADNDALYVDGENAFFVFDSASAATADDLTVVAPTSGTGRWIRSGRNPVVAATASFRNQAAARFYEQSGNGTNYVGLSAPDSLSADLTFKLPTADGSASQVLKTDGSKNLGWATVATVEKTITTTTITSDTTIGTSTSDIRFLSSASAFNLTLDNTFSAGRELFLVNDGTAEVTLKANDASVIATIYRKTSYRVVCKSSTPADNSSWVGLTPIISPEYDNSSNYTPNATAYGTVTEKFITQQRVGDSLIIRGRWKSGTIGASTAYVTLPSGIAIDTTRISSTNNTALIGFWNNMTSVVGTTAVSSNDDHGPAFLDNTQTGRVYFTKFTGSSVFGQTNNTNIQANNHGFSFEVKIPVSGWTVTKG